MSTEEQQQQEEQHEQEQEQQQYTPTQEEIDQFWENERQRLKDDIAKEAKKNALNGIDEDLKSLTGEAKGNQPTHKYLKSSFEKLNTRLKDLETENTTLKEGGTQDEILKSQITTKDNVIKDLQTQLQTIQTESHLSNIKTGIVSEIQDVPLSKSLMAEPHTRKLVEAEKERVVNDMLKNSETMEGGKVLYKRPDGKPWLNGTGGYETAGEVYRQLMKDYIEVAAPDTGAGTGQEGKPTGRSLSDDAPVDTLENAMKFLEENHAKYGIAKHSEDYFKERDKINKKLGI